MIGDITAYQDYCPRCKRWVRRAWDGLIDPVKWVCAVCRFPLHRTDKP